MFAGITTLEAGKNEKGDDLVMSMSSREGE
jgi:hypothetical protein